MLILDSSRLATYAACPKQYQLRYVEDWVHVDRNEEAPNFGTCVHVFLENYYNGASFEDSLELALSELLEEPNTFYTPERLREVCESYLSTYTQEPFESIATETYFSLSLSSDIIYEGRIDLIAHSSTGLFYVIDHKTTKSAYWLNTRRSPQAYGYIWAASHLLDKPIESIEFMLNAILLHKNQADFQRFHINASSSKIEEWKESVEAYARLIEAETFPQTLDPRICHRYGGCQFLNYCNAPPSLRKLILERFYRKEPWTPLTLEESKNEIRRIHKDVTSTIPSHIQTRDTNHTGDDS